MQTRFQFSLWISLVLAASTFALAPQDLAGSFQYVAGQNPGIGNAIEAAIADMSFVVRPMARSRLTSTNRTPEQVQMQINGAAALIRMGAKAPPQLPLTGAPVAWTDPDGEEVQVSAQWTGSSLVETFQGKDGKRVNTFVLQADGKTLRMDVVVSSPRLPQPVKYSLLFRR